jgi:hypothetical protein
MGMIDISGEFKEASWPHPGGVKDPREQAVGRAAPQALGGHDGPVTCNDALHDG